jgi:catechol 2,3-dioxygenase-like lactoylglutathione lyase family enzyme
MRAPHGRYHKQQASNGKEEFMLSSKRLVTFIGTRDPEPAKAFYQQTLGLHFVSQDQFAVVFYVNGTMLRITTVPDLVPAKHTILGWDVGEITETIASLRRRGVQFEHYDFLLQDEHEIWTSPSGAKVAWFKDPDGNLLSLTQF